ncbi:MAG: outer membrane beta-barrel protein, partial [Sulfuricaulis sp.]|nr:outer membrane beta-barrel protein [Sulfuricaulis sp.]
TGSLQHSRVDYIGSNAIRDSDLDGVGVGYRRAFIGKWQPLVVISGGYSQENNRQYRNDLGRDIYSIGVVASFSPAPRWAASVGGGYQASRYQDIDTLFTTTRWDDYYAFNATLGYALTRNLSLRGEAVLSKNHSNLELYEYQRNMIGFKLRYDFK